MKANVVCGDHDALIAYLYGECEPEQRRVVSAHIAVCQRCADELMALDGTREQLASWLPPEVPLGFRVVSQAESAPPAPVLRPRQWWGQPLPAWAQAAAAAVIFGVGVSLGALRGATATAPRAATVAVPVATQGAASSGVSPADLVALEQRLRSEIAQAQVTRASSTESPAPALLERVRTMIDESEQRQQKELAIRTAEMLRDFDTQRRVDLTRIERTLGQIDGTTGVEVEQQRQLLNYLMRVSQRGQ